MRNELAVTAMPACLTYMTPARGGWSVVRRALLLPESYLVFIGMPACMRHIILSSIELGVEDRLSFIALNDANLATGAYESTVVEEISAAIPQLPVQAKVIRMFFTCMDDLLRTDHAAMIDALSDRFPDLIFAVSHMNPIRADSPLPPPVAILSDLFSLLRAPMEGWRPDESGTIRGRVNFIANNIAVPKENLICRWLSAADFTVQHISDFKTFEDFQSMACAALNVVVQPLGIRAAEEMRSRLGIPFVYCPYSYLEEEIEANFSAIAAALKIDLPDFRPLRAEVETEARRSAEALDGYSIVIDYAATYRPFSMALFLTERGLPVRQVYASEWLKTEDQSRERLISANPGIEILDPSAPARVKERKTVQNAVAIGFEAAYLSGAAHVVPYCADEFGYGYDAMLQLLRDLRHAAEETIDLERAVKESGYTV